MRLLNFFIVLTALIACPPAYSSDSQGQKEMNRITLADQKYETLFSAKRTPHSTDPEFMNILQNLIFGEVFYIGDLDDKTRELITVAALTGLQTLPQLKSHVQAALTVGNSPVEIRETIYQAAPFIGFPRTLNALAVFNEVLKEKGIQTPLENQTTVTEENRLQEGEKIQSALYGDEVKKAMRSLPEEYQNAVPELLTKFCFSDFYTRKGLTVKQRELLSFVVLASIGAEKQLSAHVLGNLKAGNSKETLLAAMIQAAPYIGLPNALSAINLIKNTQIDNYQPIYEK